MIFDTHNNNIILISYPAGGFGNFLYYILTEFAKDTVKTSRNKNFKFSSTGNSHSSRKYTNPYFGNPDNYEPTIDKDVDIVGKRILVLADVGLDNSDHTYTKTKQVFPNAQILRVCVDDVTKYLIQHTVIEKALGENFNDISTAHAEQHWGKNLTDFDLRENYTLMFHHHDQVESELFKQIKCWATVDQPNVVNLSLKYLIDNPVECIVSAVHQLGMEVINKEPLTELCKDWQDKNKKYFLSIQLWDQIQQHLSNNTNMSLTHVDRMYDQAYINYQLEKSYNIVMPAYDYRHWFTSVNDIRCMIGKISQPSITQ